MAVSLLPARDRGGCPGRGDDRSPWRRRTCTSRVIQPSNFEAVDDDQLGAGHRLGVGRRRRIDMGVAIGPDQRRDVDAIAADLAARNRRGSRSWRRRASCSCAARRAATRPATSRRQRASQQVTTIQTCRLSSDNETAITSLALRDAGRARAAAASPPCDAEQQRDRDRAPPRTRMIAGPAGRLLPAWNDSTSPA